MRDFSIKGGRKAVIQGFQAAFGKAARQPEKAGEPQRVMVWR
ncbi:hypothetical protein [Kingella oralis]|nr:hypothetical protein [Kingella oralis]